MLKTTLIALALLLIVRLAHAEYTVAFPEGDYSPQYSNSRGQVDGFLPDLIKRFSNDSGYDFRLKALPIKRYQKLLQQGHIDFILPSNPAWTDTSAGNVLFSSVIMISRSGYIRRRDSVGELVKDVATVQGYTLPKISSTFRHASYRESFTINTHASLEMLRRQRVDSVYAHLDFVKSWLKINDLKDYLIFQPNLGFDNYSYHLATLRHKDLLEIFDKWMVDNNIVIKNLMKKHDVGRESLID